MSKAVKTMLREELVRRLTGREDLAVVNLAGIDGVTTNQLRRSLREKNIQVTVVKNSVARQALEEVGLGYARDLIDGPTALVIATGPEQVEIVSVVRELVERTRELPALQVRGAVMEGEVFGPDRVEALSRYPTREEAVAQAVTLVLSPGSRLVAAVQGPGGRLAAILKAIEERGGEDAPAPVPAE